MSVYEDTREDIDELAHYWMLRKFMFLDWTTEMYVRIVEPAAERGPLPKFNDHIFYNMSYTEWLLFECEMREGCTPLELYIDSSPEQVSPEALERLRQVRDSQFFSKFEIMDKDLETGIVVLRDVHTDLRYDVWDPCICEMERWRHGTIATRIGCVEGRWMYVGQMHLYDKAHPAETVADGPGEFHEEDREERPYLEHAGFYLRLMHDVLGYNGRYHHTMRTMRPGECEARAS